MSARHSAPLIFRLCPSMVNLPAYMRKRQWFRRKLCGGSCRGRARLPPRCSQVTDAKAPSHEHNLKKLVAGETSGAALQIENLAPGHAHDRDRDPMPRLVDTASGVVWS